VTNPAGDRPTRRLAILGSTGSIGRSALSVVEAHRDRLEIVAMAAGGNVALFAEQVRAVRPRAVAMASSQAIDRLRHSGDLGGATIAGHGSDGLIALATHPDVDLVLCASSGTAALEAVLAAIEAGKTIALANKEVLVMAGALMTDAARRCGVAILPVDSEHNAIHQCLRDRPAHEVSRLILTASGGPFRGHSPKELRSVAPSDALKHPTWRMGRKITIDSATLMNKGLEVIEARWLFGVPADRIDVVVHPQSVVHSMVEMVDGSILAQLGVTDMRLPIQYAFSYPERWASPLPRLDLARCGRLDFHLPDHEKFPGLRLAYRALDAGGGLSAVLNAANEVAVEAFLGGRLRFTSISELIEQAMNAHVPATVASLADIRRVDAWARAYSQELVRELDVLNGQGRGE
jgi:1-deoxy-D-xylulose-5-phosphate reductoisomerase